MVLPIVSARINHSQSRSSRLSFGQAIRDACHCGGMFYLVDHDIPTDLIEAVLSETAAFFDQSDEEKASIHIKKSTNHRGYGLLKNYRDWREQIHLGVEAQPNSNYGNAPYWALWGANQWPRSPGDRFKQTMLAYFSAIDKLSRYTLTALATALDQREDFFTTRMKDRPYLLMKAMSYLPQEKSANTSSELQSGVTPHCDWSWLTFLIQDQVGGLEAQGKDGIWHPVDPIHGSIVVNTGELLELESGGAFSASPHRVINSRIDKQRYSVPLFINPALDAEIIPAGIFRTKEEGDHRPESKTTEPEKAVSFTAPQEKQKPKHPHVHKVIEPGSIVDPFTFGTSEWQRKGEGRWCYQNECLKAI